MKKVRKEVRHAAETSTKTHVATNAVRIKSKLHAGVPPDPCKR